MEILTALFGGISAFSGGLFTFLGGATFRWLLGSVLDFMKAKQDQTYKMDLLKLQNDLETSRINLRAGLAEQEILGKLRIIDAEKISLREKYLSEAFLRAVEGVNLATQQPGFFGKWNAAIRPALATIAMVMIVSRSLFPQYVNVDTPTLQLYFAVLGVFVGERIHYHSRPSPILKVPS